MSAEASVAARDESTAAAAEFAPGGRVAGSGRRPAAARGPEERAAAIKEAKRLRREGRPVQEIGDASTDHRPTG
jgi:hypothetical protein